MIMMNETEILVLSQLPNVPLSLSLLGPVIIGSCSWQPSRMIMGTLPNINVHKNEATIAKCHQAEILH